MAPLLARPGPEKFSFRSEVLSRGPLRSLVKVEYDLGEGGGPVLTAFLSAFADNPASRTDLLLARPGPAGRVSCGPGLEKLEDGAFTVDKEAGCVSEWGRGADGAGGIGLAVIFDPAALAGLSEEGPDQWVRLSIPPDGRRTFWVLAGWEKGIVAPPRPPDRNWARRAVDLAAELLVPLEVRFTGR